MPKADKLSPGGVKFLKERQIALLSALMLDGAPHATPVWVDVTDDGAEVLINTDAKTLKGVNTARDNRVALAVVDSNDQYRTVVVRGTVIDRRRDCASDHVDSLARKYLGREKYPHLRPDSDRLVLHIKPSHVMERGTE